MTVEDVLGRLADIEASKGDDESAHGMQDRLLADVLRAIAEAQCADPHALAHSALRVLDIEFSRWCA